MCALMINSLLANDDCLKRH